MESFEYQGKKLEVWTQSGTVLSASKHSRTSVSSHGGGGWVGPHGGSVSAPTISSSTTTEQEIWIRRENGEETAVKLVNKDIPLREGQRITFIAAKQPKDNDGFWVTLVNHSANRHWRLCNNIEVSRKGKLAAYPLVKWHDFIIAFVFLWAAQGLVFMLGGLAALLAYPLALSYLVLRWRSRVRNRNRIFVALDAWAERNAQQAYLTERTATPPATTTEKVA